MPLILKPKRSLTPSSVPTGLSENELALNIPDKIIYIGNSTGGATPVSNFSSPGSVSISTTEINILKPTNSITLTVTDGSITPSSKIIATQSGAAATGRLADENELTNLSCSTIPGTGSFSLIVKCADSWAFGKYKINYMVG